MKENVIKESIMRSGRCIAAIVVASFLVGLFPGIARADSEVAPNSAASSPIKASVDRAAARLAAQRSVDTPNQRAASAAQGMPTGGGGGKGMLIVSLVTTVVGLGATYYILKEMQKQTDQATKQ